MVKKRITDEDIDRQIEKVEAAKAEAALEADAMFDYIEIEGVKFYRPTLAHAWVLAELPKHTQGWFETENLCVIAYILTLESSKVRNVFFQLLRKSPKKIPDIAWDFFVKANIHPAEAFKTIDILLKDLSPKKTVPPSPLDGGGESFTE